VAIVRLDHVNIITPRFEQTLAFYQRALKMRLGPSPIGEIGAFLYDGSNVASIHVAKLTSETVDHLLATNLAHRTRQETDPSDGFASLVGSAALDHVALNCSGFVETVAHLEAQRVPFRYFYIEAQDLHQIFIRDPNDIILELRFFEAVPAEITRRLNRGAIAAADSATGVEPSGIASKRAHP
jgi:catechol 2,3-dioxygenase-like lactoylglutathione lyase family enzyme